MSNDTHGNGTNAATAIAEKPAPAPPRDWSAKPIATAHLLTDEQVADFICKGFMILQPDHRPGLNEAIDAQLTAMQQNPGDRIWEEVPLLSEVYEHPMVRGALASLLGHDVAMHSHRHWHCRYPGPHSQDWHQDSRNERHHQIRTVLGMYYPHDVPLELGPTVVMPGSHFRNAPTDRMATFGNIRGQAVVTVKAGAVAITHYDIWHAGTINRTDRPRHMLKFLFSRKSEPTGPSWNHDPIDGNRIGTGRIGHWPPGLSQSDHYKLLRTYRECWDYMLGKGAAKPGA